MIYLSHRAKRDREHGEDGVATVAIEYDFTLADATFYEPVSAANPGTRYLPAEMPTPWQSVESDIWTNWFAPGVTTIVEAGWKVHVSSSRESAAAVLDIVARTAVEHGIAFKHLTGTRFFALMHGKHSSRAQSGKFCALYPNSEELARTLMTALAERLADYSGPYVLSDRRFQDSSCVYYRYGAFRPHHTLQVDGTRRYELRTAEGTMIPDERKPEFLLPPGIEDPFEVPAESSESECEDEAGELAFGGYAFETVLRPSNGGGAYRGRSPEGRTVFIKEARAHNGYTVDTDSQHRLRGEYDVLVELATNAPGLAPAPLDYFRHWEHEFLVSEFVPGRSLRRWMADNAPVLRPGSSAPEHAAYYQRALRLIRRIGAALDRLHEQGYAFVDVAPDNVLVDDDDNIRLIDFEATQPSDEPLRMLFTPGYVQPQVLMSAQVRAETPPLEVDAYGLSALALELIFPLHAVYEASPGALAHLRADLADDSAVPGELWQLVERNYPQPTVQSLPAPESARRDPLTALRELRARSLDALLAMARTDGDRWVYPTTPDGLRTNTRCVAHGTAGVLHAIRYAGLEPEQRVVDRLRGDSLREKNATPPGLFLGNAGISWVLAEAGESEAAAELLDTAMRDPLLERSATLGTGLAGVAMAQLAVYARGGPSSHLDDATRLLDLITEAPSLPALLGPNNASGLASGRPGIALAMYYLARLGGDARWLDRGERLLRDELEHRVELGPQALGFSVSDTDRRKLPYLFSGSAGFAAVLARYLLVRPDSDMQSILDQCLNSLRSRFTVFAGLFQGQAGLALVAGEVADLHGRADLLEQEMIAGRSLLKFAVAHETGVRWLGDQGQRISADLWSGSAGIVVALHRMLHGSPDPLFTLDHAIERRESNYLLLAGTGPGDPVAAPTSPTLRH